MTDAEHVACDALRMAGLKEVADNLEFAREAVRLRKDLIEMLERDAEGYCAACGVDAELESHQMSCRLVPLFATQDGWSAVEIERAHDEALRQELLRTTPSPLGEWVQQQPGQLFGLDPATWRLNDVVTGAPHTPAGRLEQAGIWVLHRCTGGRNAHEPDMMHVGLYASPATAMRHVRSVHPQAPDWAPTSLGDFECWIEPFEESNDADKPCRGEWWSLCAMEVRE
jgi:hypothetical protein